MSEAGAPPPDPKAAGGSHLTAAMLAACWIVRHGAFWDFCYEHCNYFRESSLRAEAVNTVALRRRIADATIAKGGYSLA